MSMYVCAWLCLAKRPEQCAAAPHIINIHVSSPRHTLPPRFSSLLFVVLCRRSNGRSHRRRPSFRSSLPFNRKRHFIVLYTHTHKYIPRAHIYIQPLWRFNRETTTFRPPVEYRDGGGRFCTPNAHPATVTITSRPPQINPSSRDWYLVAGRYILYTLKSVYMYIICVRIFHA